MSGRRAKRERRLARAVQAPRSNPTPVVQTTGPQRYEVLHYRGDVTGNDAVQPGRILGHDEFGRPYEVLDAEVGYHCPHGTDHPRCQVRTSVNLQYASADNLRSALTAAGVASEGRAGEPS